MAKDPWLAKNRPPIAGTNSPTVYHPRKQDSDFTMSRHNSRKNTLRNQLNYGHLEDRVLLAADLTGRNLVVNGGFDQITSGETPNGWYQDVDVNGWTAASSADGQQIALATINSDRGTVLQVDSTDRLFDVITQDIQTEADAQYILAFDFRTRPVDLNADALSNDLEVSWGGISQGQFTAANHWQTVTLEVTGNGDLMELMFSEVAEATGSATGDGHGPLIDNIQLLRVSDAPLVNGSFETATGGNDGLFNTDNVAGWTAIGTSAANFVEIADDADATDGNRYLNLDTTADVLDRVFQTVSTTADGTYFLSFDLRSSSGQQDPANELRVRWNDEWAGTFRGDDDWQNFGLVLTADSDDTRLVFREATLDGGFSTGSGPEIDNIQLFRLDSIAEDLAVDLNGEGDGSDGAANYDAIEGGQQQVALGDLVVSNENGGFISSATVVLSNPLDFTNNGVSLETLAVATEGTNIDAVYNGSLGILRLIGDDSIANYESVLSSLTYENTADNPNVTDRIIAVSVSENGVTSNAGEIAVSIADVDDDPMFVNQETENTEVEVGQTASVDVVAFDPDATGITYSIESVGNDFLQGGPQPTISEAGVVSWTPDRLGTLTAIVTATDGTGNSISTSFDLTSFATNDEQRIQNFLLENNMESQVTESGLHYIIEEEGNGVFPNENSAVTVNYQGTFFDGSEFDAANDISFGLQQVIPGWTEGLQLLSEGGSGRLILPADLAYGAAGRPGIPPNSILVFDIDLLSTT